MGEKSDDPLIGVSAHEFCLPDSQGSEVCLEQYRGKWVVLYFYPRDNTPGCTLEAISFDASRESFAGLGAQVIGVSNDPPKSHSKFADRHNLSILLLSDTGHRVIEAYQSLTEKKMYGKTVSGTQRDTFLIDPDGRIVNVWRKVSPKGHADEVQKALRTRLSGSPG